MRFNFVFKSSVRVLAAGVVFAALFASAAAAQEAEGDYLRLADRLDRPQDGYCLDITGAGEWTQFHRPLIVHNCKTPRAIAADELVEWTAEGRIRFPAFDLCATAHGIFRRTISGAPVVLNRCGAEPDEELQIFHHRADGKIALANSGLCLQAGKHSDRTWEKTHRWRTLALHPCEEAPVELSAWEKVGEL